MNRRVGLPVIACAALVAVNAWSQSMPSESAPNGPATATNNAQARAEFFDQLSPEKQEQFIKLLNEWSTLAPQQRQDLLEQFEKTRNLNPLQKDRLQRWLQQFADMPPAERTQILDRMHRWQQMTPDQREKLRARLREYRQKAIDDMHHRLETLGVQPTSRQMLWIQHFYFRKKHEVNRQALDRKRELEAQLPAAATDAQRKQARQQAREYRNELDQQAMKEFDDFARNPHPLSPAAAPGGPSTQGSRPIHPSPPSGPDSGRNP